jgi:hypothetical protein
MKKEKGRGGDLASETGHACQNRDAREIFFQELREKGWTILSGKKEPATEKWEPWFTVKHQSKTEKK